MSEERFAFGPEVFGLDDRKSVEAVIHLLDRTYEQAHAEQSAEDVLYDFCIAYLEQAKKQETLSEEDANKRLKVIVQWYAQHARTASGEQIIPEEAAKDMQDNWDEWLHGPEPLFSGLFRKKRREKHVSVDETSEEPAQEAPKADKHMHHEPRVNISSHGAKVALVVVGMIVCFLVGMAAGWGLSNSGKMVQLTIGQSASQSDESADKTEESAEENVAVMKWGMNVRSEPTTKTEKNILTALKKGDTITILSKADDNGWIKISSTDEDGNVISGYMQSVYDGETVYTMK